MAKNSIDAYGAEGKSNVLMFDPDKLWLVEDESHPLYDPRIKLPVSDALVRNIMHHGVLQAITVAKDAETGLTMVVAGRQRVKAAREANKRLLAEGLEPIQVPALARRSPSVDLAGVMVSENELRENDTPLGRASKMARLMNMGKTEAQVAILFGCTTETVRDTLSILDCCEDVIQAIDAGQITATHAKALAKLPPQEQRTKVAEMVAVAGEPLKPHERARKQRAVVWNGGGKPGRQAMRTRKEIDQKLAEVGLTAEWKAALIWVVGAPR